jgi:uncharacterized protein with HEPN domain
MKKRDDRVYLRHILDSIARIENYLREVDESIFMSSDLLQDGVIRQIQIIGEASKRISPDLRTRYQLIPWQDMAGMRNKLVHDYFGVDAGLVWITATEDLPALKKLITQVISELPK